MTLELDEQTEEPVRDILRTMFRKIADEPDKKKAEAIRTEYTAELDRLDNEGLSATDRFRKEVDKRCRDDDTTTGNDDDDS